MKYAFRFIIVLSLVAVLSGAVSCSKNVELPEQVTASAENLLISLNNDDYDGFTRDFNETMLGAITSDVFTNNLSPFIRGNVGIYIPGTIEVLKSTESNGVNVVVFLAKYTQSEKGVAVQISWSIVNEAVSISGLYFNSEELSG